MALSLMAIEEIARLTKSLDDEEMQIVVKNLPTKLLNDEIYRRTEVATSKLADLFGILEKVNSDISLEDMQEILANCKKVLKMG